MAQEERRTYQVAADEGVRLEDPSDAHRGRTGQRELHRHGVPDCQMIGVGRGRVDEQTALGKHVRAARCHAQDDGLGQRLCRHCDEVL